MTRFFERQTEGDRHRSNIAYGPGIYFSQHPYTSLNHFYNEDHAGLACRLQGVQVTNLNSIQRQLIESGFYFGDATTNPPTLGSYPTGRNELKDPAAFRRYSRGHLVEINNIFIDVGAIDYQRAATCEPIELRHFRSCDAMVALINRSLFHGGSTHGPLYNYLTQRQGELQMLQFKSRLIDCGKLYLSPNDMEDDPSVDPEVKLAQFCQTFSYKDYKNRALYRAEKEFFDYLRANYCS